MSFVRTALQRLGLMARSIDPPLHHLLLLMRPGVPLVSAAAEALPVPPPLPARPYLMLGNGLAAVPLVGALSKYSSALRLFGSPPTAKTTGELGASIRAAAEAPDVRGILLLVDSPGGTVAGTLELAQEVAAAAARKPVHAYAQDSACSAALWVASQASRFTTNAVGHVGSIGTAIMLADTSAAAASAGIRFLSVTTGVHKATGAPGLPVTAEQLAALQEMVEAINVHFLAGLASGRGMTIDQVRAIADGRVFIGQRAVDLGLADAVETLDECLAGLAAAAGVDASDVPTVAAERDGRGDVAVPAERGRSRGGGFQAAMTSALAGDFQHFDEFVDQRAELEIRASHAPEVAARELLQHSVEGLRALPDEVGRHAYALAVTALRSGDDPAYRQLLRLVEGAKAGGAWNP